jgi:hypothetical protein
MSTSAPTHSPMLATMVRINKSPSNPDNADRLAALLTATPSARAQFFSNPMKVIGRSLPPPKFWDYGRARWAWLPWYWYRPLLYRRQRRALAQEIFNRVAGAVVDQTLSSSINTDTVFDEFFSPVVRISQRSYSSVYILSWAAFVAGLALIGVGAYVGIEPPARVNGTVVAGIFGGSGAISALGSAYGMSVTGIRQASSDLGRVRIVLTAFATQLGQLRALYESSSTSEQVPTVDAVQQLNQSIATALSGALAGMPSPSSSSNAT